MNTDLLNTELLNTEDLIKENSQPPPPHNLPPDPEPVDEDEALAYEKLESPDGKDWANSSVFMNTGRRPMKDYPEIWLTPTELTNVIRDWRAANIPIAKWRKGFLATQSKLKTHELNGKSADRTAAFFWLTGFIRNQLVQEAINDQRLEKVNSNASTYARSN